MAGWMRIVLAAGAIGLIAVIVAMLIGSRRQQRDLLADANRLIRAGTARAAAPQADAEVLSALPAPVSRYLRWALGAGQRIQDVRIRQIGTLRTEIRSDRWMPFEAEHLVVPPATGFMWNARVQVAPLLHVRVCDTLIEGRGAGQVSLLSVFTVSADAGTPEMNSGSLHRYLAEAVWYPTALLPSPSAVV